MNLSKFAWAQRKKFWRPLAGGVNALCETSRHDKGLSVHGVLASLTEEKRQWMEGDGHFQILDVDVMGSKRCGCSAQQPPPRDRYDSTKRNVDEWRSRTHQNLGPSDPHSKMYGTGSSQDPHGWGRRGGQAGSGRSYS